MANNQRKAQRFGLGPRHSQPSGKRLCRSAALWLERLLVLLALLVLRLQEQTADELGC